jgi:unsaturated rhamnogalacturonyl hydrolase
MINKNKHIVYILTIFSLFVIGPVHGQDTSRWSVKMAESIMYRSPGGITNWDYVSGTILEGFEEVWRTTGDDMYYNYINSSISSLIQANGDITGYSMTEYNIDEVKEGTVILTIYKQTNNPAYKLAAENIREQFYGHPRTNEGGFWHKKVYPWQMWLDGLYMGCPFYTEYGRLFNEPDNYDDVMHQITQMEKHARDSVTGLLYHGWDESLTQAWADPVTGQSASFWGRAMGWYAMAIVDVLDFLPENNENRDTIIGVFQRLAKAIADYQDPDNKVWWQVLDRGGDANNYTESSASCMFVYALAKAIRLGYIDQTYKQVVMDGYNGIIDEFIEENPNGTINLTKTCAVAGLGGNRDGSYEYYTEGTYYRTNDGKGMGPFILASAEIEMMESLYPVALLMVDSITTDGVYLEWSSNPAEADNILIERKSDENFDIIATLGADINQYIDTSSLESETLYTYRIRSFNSTDTSFASNFAIIKSLATTDTTVSVPGLNDDYPQKGNSRNILIPDYNSLFQTLTISFFSDNLNRANIILLDQSGRIMQKLEVKSGTDGWGECQFSTSALAKGIYFVALTTINEIKTEKVIIF